MHIQQPILEGLPEGTPKGEATYQGSGVGSSLFQLSLFLCLQGNAESQSQKLYSLCTRGFSCLCGNPSTAMGELAVRTVHPLGVPKGCTCTACTGAPDPEEKRFMLFMLSRLTDLGACM